MRQKFVFVTAIAVCLTLTLVPAFASERTVDRNGDRTKAAKGVSANGVAPEFSDMTRRIPADSRLSGSNSAANKAAAMISAAAKQDGETAIATLQMVVMMDFESTDQTDRIRSTAFEMLAGQYVNAPSKQVMNLGMALQYASDSARRAGLEDQITALGGDVFALTFNSGGLNNAYTTRDPGADDSCLGAVAVTLPHSEVMDITPAGDHNWRSFDIAGPDGALMRIETISDFPGSGTDDTDLTLWNDCPENGGTIIAFNDDTATDFTSRIDTGCLAPGTYFVEVGGFFDISTPDNFTLEIEVTATCEVPSVDSFEPDDDRADASSIGLPTPTSGNGWGRTHKEIQARNIFPAGDVDNATVGLTQNSLVRMGTRAQWGTFFNGFEQTGAATNPDTILELFYEIEPDYGGRCNQPDLGFLPVCFSDADCPDPLDNPMSDFPDCIPIQLFAVPVEFENPIATNDDRGGGDFGSELLLCLPRTGANSPSLTLSTPNPGGTGGGGDFMVRITPFSSNDNFDYELNVKNEVGCLFEQEPNNSFATTTPYAIGSFVSGHYDFVVTNPYGDADLYSFDVDETTTIAFETFATDSLQSDTGIELFVGPDDNGDFFFLLSDDDSGAGFLSAVTVTLPPANDLLGNTTADADYIWNVTSFFYNPNYAYVFGSAVIAAPDVTETEPNDTEATANPVSLGDTVAGAIDVGCDYDTYTFTIGADTFVTVESTAGGDSAIQLTDCSGGFLGCDDDSGAGLLPLLDGCLPAGTYCAQVRAFSASDTFAYELDFSGTAGCTPTTPPTISGDNAFTCLDFDTCP